MLCNLYLFFITHVNITHVAGITFFLKTLITILITTNVTFSLSFTLRTSVILTTITKRIVLYSFI